MTSFLELCNGDTRPRVVCRSQSRHRTQDVSSHFPFETRLSGACVLVIDVRRRAYLSRFRHEPSNFPSLLASRLLPLTLPNSRPRSQRQCAPCLRSDAAGRPYQVAVTVASQSSSYAKHRETVS